MSTRKTIVAKQYNSNPTKFEKDAVAALYPGHMVEVTSADKVQKHSVSGGNALPPMFALEDSFQGNTIDDEYSADDNVFVWVPQRGDWVNAVLANGENVSIGDALESNGDGTLKKYVADSGSVTIYPNQIVGIAMEAVNMSGSSGADPSGPDDDGRIDIMVV